MPYLAINPTSKKLAVCPIKEVCHKCWLLYKLFTQALQGPGEREETLVRTVGFRGFPIHYENVWMSLKKLLQILHVPHIKKTSAVEAALKAFKIPCRHYLLSLIL